MILAHGGQSGLFPVNRTGEMQVFGCSDDGRLGKHSLTHRSISVARCAFAAFPCLYGGVRSVVPLVDYMRDVRFAKVVTAYKIRYAEEVPSHVFLVGEVRLSVRRDVFQVILCQRDGLVFALFFIYERGGAFAAPGETVDAGLSGFQCESLSVAEGSGGFPER